MLPLRAAIYLVFLFILLPTVAQFLDCKQGLEIIRRDRILTQINTLLVLMRWVFIVVAPSLMLLSNGVLVFNLGASFTVMVRTLVTSLVETSSLSTVYTHVSMMSSIGSLMARPLLAGMYHLGIVLDSIWLGLPFIFAAETDLLW